MTQTRIAAAQFERNGGVEFAEALHMGLVEHHVIEWNVRFGIAGPVEVVVDDDRTQFIAESFDSTRVRVEECLPRSERVQRSAGSGCRQCVAPPQLKLGTVNAPHRTAAFLERQRTDELAGIVGRKDADGHTECRF